MNGIELSLYIILFLKNIYFWLKDSQNESQSLLKIEKLWLQVDKQIKDTKYLDKSEPFVKTCKTIRVFVSSTFTDFFNEREILVKRVNLIKIILLSF